MGSSPSANLLGASGKDVKQCHFLKTFCSASFSMRILSRDCNQIFESVDVERQTRIGNGIHSKSRLLCCSKMCAKAPSSIRRCDNVRRLSHQYIGSTLHGRGQDNLLGGGCNRAKFSQIPWF